MENQHLQNPVQYAKASSNAQESNSLNTPQPQDKRKVPWYVSDWVWSQPMDEDPPIKKFIGSGEDVFFEHSFEYVLSED